VFKHLGREQTRRIAEMHVFDLKERLLKSHEIILDASTEAVNWLSEQGYDERSGARAMKRCIERFVEEPLAMRVLDGTFRRREIVAIRLAPTGEGIELLSDVGTVPPSSVSGSG
jgi:ATP-dependent Clp protease ATP-binding subunit ClpB